MMKPSFARALSHRPGAEPAGRTASCLARILLVLAALFALPGAPALAQGQARGFDHLTTGFALTGQHQTVRCEDCHVQGTFRGTPTRCAACHTPGARVTAVIIPGNHIPTAEPCDACHTTASFYGAHFAHAMVVAGTCAVCHNGLLAKGKNPGHLFTNASCDACHTTVSFTLPFASYPNGHIPTSMSCTTCHAVSQFAPSTGYPRSMNHAGISSGCGLCHAAGAAPLIFVMPGTLVAANGSTVIVTQNGNPVTVQPMSNNGQMSINWSGDQAGASVAAYVTHIPTTNSCELCHAKGFGATPMTFVGAAMSHAGITSGCLPCHEAGITFAPMSPPLVTRPALMPATVGGGPHPGTASGDCVPCHAASLATFANFKGGVGAYPSGHIVLSAAANAACGDCHKTGLFTQYTSPMPHADTGGTCTSCHGGSDYAGPFAGEAIPGSTSGSVTDLLMVPTSTSFHPNSTGAPNPGAAHIAIPASQQCSVCHASTGAFGPYGSNAVMSHAGIASNNCTSCHASGATFLGMTAATLVNDATHPTHIPLSGGNAPWASSPDCGTCHYTAANGKNFAAGSFLTTWVPTYHGSLTAHCDTCHEAGKSFYNSPNLITRPATVPAAAGGGAHPVGPGDCVVCHAASLPAFTSWAGGIGMPARHILVSGANTCTTCHNSTSGSATTYSLYAIPMPHAGVTGTCTSCHGSAGSDYAGPFSGEAIPGSATGNTNNVLMVPTSETFHPNSATAPNPSSAHIPVPVAQQCSVCHGTTTAFGPYGSANVAMSHAGIASTNCASCHLGGSTFLGMTSSTLVSDATHPTHIPLAGGNAPWPSSPDCGTCHYTAANGKAFAAGSFLVTWLPTYHGSLTAHCDTCHEAGKSFYGSPSLITRPATVPAAAGGGAHPAGPGDCIACHAASLPAFTSWTGGVGLPAKHIAVSATCVTCHTATSGGATTFTLYSIPMPHAGAVSGTCTSCHGLAGSDYAGPFAGEAIPGSASGSLTDLLMVPTSPSFHPNSASAPNPTAAHIPVPATQPCSVCHGSTTAFGPYGSNATMSHAGIASTNCASCHVSGSTFLGMTAATLVNDATHPTHIPLTGGNAPWPTSPDCGTCHYTAANAAGFAPASFLLTWLPTYHGKLAAHCDTCHEAGKTFYGSPNLITRPSTFTGSQNGGNGGTHPAGPGDCITCHAASLPAFTAWTGGVNGTPAKHITVTTATACNTCHTTSYYTQYAAPMPHAGVTGTCTSCHGGSDYTGPFAGEAIPGNTTGTTSDVLMVPTSISFHPNSASAPNPTSAHLPIPTSQLCSVCHGTTTAFGPYGSANVAMSHTGIASTNCSGCHLGGSTFLGMTSSTLVSDLTHPTHIPLSGGSAPWPTAPDCGTCHYTAANGKAFAAGSFLTTWVPTFHGSLAAHCDTCHEAGKSFYNSPNLITRPSTFTGTQNGGKGGTHPPGPGDCVACHSASMPAFTTWTGGINGVPPYHISITSSTACNSCHTTSYFTQYITPMPHTGVVGTCTSCHGGTDYIGPFAGEAIPGNTTGTSTDRLMVPTSMSFHPNSTTASNPSSPHIIVATGNQLCSNCHSGTTTFTGGVYHHSAPYLTGSRGTYTKSSSTYTGGYTPTCKSCHSTWSGNGYTSQLGLSNSIVIVGFSSHQGANTAVQDCADSGCHSLSSLPNGKGAAPTRVATVGRIAAVTPTRGVTTLSPGSGVSRVAGTTTPVVNAPYSHQGVLPGSCASCHRPGGSAIAQPGNHLPTPLACDACHRTTAWLPALYAHAGVAPGSCGSCHQGNWATAKPAGHFLTNASCDTCHHSTAAWSPQAYSHLSRIYSPHPSSVLCTDCHITNNATVIWKYPPLRPGCGGCHGPNFSFTAGRKGIGSTLIPPR